MECRPGFEAIPGSWNLPPVLRWYYSSTLGVTNVCQTKPGFSCRANSPEFNNHGSLIPVLSNGISLNATTGTTQFPTGTTILTTPGSPVLWDFLSHTVPTTNVGFQSRQVTTFIPEHEHTYLFPARVKAWQLLDVLGVAQVTSLAGRRVLSQTHWEIHARLSQRAKLHGGAQPRNLEICQRSPELK